ncbi:MAG TPA: NAD(P)-dependent oxidoreductase [Gemmatimonadaceae bacterium]|nr:NAD(P)-dependent oxidoreductase [Gemmatimonadaceae bacterium]
MDTGAPVAFLGLGAMGNPMAHRLVDAGYLVTAWNRTPGRADALIKRGARVADSPRDASAGARVIVVMVSDPAAVSAVLGGSRGALAGAREGSTIINTSTVGPADSVRFAEQCGKAGARYVESPVMGSIGQATSGTLVAIVSGDAAAVADVSGIVLVMAKQIIRAGAIGQASALKLVMNLLVGGTIELLAEAIAAADKSGLPLDLFRETLLSSVLASPFVGYKSPLLFERRYDAQFSTRLMLKDLDLVLASAAEQGLALPATAVIREQFARAVEAGLGEEDAAAVREVMGGEGGRQRTRR